MSKTVNFPVFLVAVVIIHIIIVYNFGVSQKEQLPQQKIEPKKSVVIELSRTTPPKPPPPTPLPPKVKEKIIEKEKPVEEPVVEKEEEFVEFLDAPTEPQNYTEYYTDLDFQETVETQNPTPAISIDSLAIIKIRYLERLRKILEENKNYPAAAKRRGMEGVVYLQFRIMADGTIIDQKVSRESQFPILNRSALETVKNIEKYEPIPAELNMESIELEIPFSFTLE